MKKLFVTTLIAGALAGSAFAQGSVNLQASAAHGLVTYSTDGVNKIAVPVGNPAQVGTYGQLNIAVYASSAGSLSPFSATIPSLLPSAWAISTTVLHQIAPLAGNSPATTFTLGTGAGGANMSLMVVG